MIGLLRWLWRRLITPHYDSTQEALKHYQPDHPTTKSEIADRLDEIGKQASDRDLMSEDEKALWADIEGTKTPPPTIQYPPKADDQDARDWVTAELERRTGGLTRHPADITDYPEPPTEADLAAREYVRNNFRFVTPFSHGYSMRYLGELLSRAKAKDRSLRTEDLMALRSRGLI